MRPYRDLKIASLIQHELGNILLRDFDFEDAIVTVSDVLVSDDLSEAKIKLSILPYEKEPDSFLLVQKRARELQFKLQRKMNIKPMPKLKFEIDKGDETVKKIDKNEEREENSQ